MMMRDATDDDDVTIVATTLRYLCTVDSDNLANSLLLVPEEALYRWVEIIQQQ